MTTYTLPATAPIGTVLYYNGDFVWFNEVDWVPVVEGTIKLNNLAAEVATDEATTQTATELLQAQIDALTDEVAMLKALLPAAVI